MKTFKFLLVLPILVILLGSTVSSEKKDIVLLKHAGYSTYYSTTLHYPVLVEWWDTRARLDCPDTKIPRKDQFAPDPQLEKSTDLAEYYVGSGLDRGHMCPAADNQCSEKLLTECFYFSNMTPQYHSLNAGDWKKLEERTRDLSLEYDSVMVWCGSIGEAKKIGTVSVPTKCWKVIYVKKTKSYEAYIFDNSANKPVGLEKCTAKIADIKKLTGYTFKP